MLPVGHCRSMPALNARSTDELDQALTVIREAVGDRPFAINLIVHPSNPRLKADLACVVRHQVPLVITSLGAVADVVQAVQSYGGQVLHDVTTLRHAQKAKDAGVDGIIAVANGAGGHAGTHSPFALVDEIRSIFDGLLVLGGAINKATRC